MEMTKILIVDDEHDICEILQFNLEAEGYEAHCAHSAEMALEMLMPDHALILLDVMMDGMSGYKMAQTLRQSGNQIPIIFLTAKDTDNDILTGFSVGGDDYISKPFSLKEVVARVKAILKRQALPGKPESTGSFVCKDLRIDFDTKEVFVEKEAVALTRTEFELLEFLIKNRERIFSREELINNIWAKTPFITERTVDVHITRLRKKLGSYAVLISNRSGYGYRFNLANLKP